VTHESPDPGFRSALRSEVAAWEPPHGPDLADLVLRADHSWRRPIALASSLGAAALAFILLLAVLTVALAPAIPGGEVIKQHLVGR
jgi:hypothetical protein